MQELSNKLNSTMRIVKTFHIEKHTNAKDPELYLKKNLDILKEHDDIDFIVISVGTNDITKLNLSEELGYLNDAACDHSKNLAHIANGISQKHNIDVFIVERPARFDIEDKDPEGIRSVVNISANGMFPSLITPMKRVHYIPLPSLNPVRTSRDCFVRDGVHLSKKGEKLFLHDLVAGVESIFSDLKKPTVGPNFNTFQQDGKWSVPKKENNNRNNCENFQPLIGDGNNRMHGAWNGNNEENRNGFQQGGNNFNRNRNSSNGYSHDVRRGNEHHNNNGNGWNRQQPGQQFRHGGQYRHDGQNRNNAQHRNDGQYRNDGHRNDGHPRNDGQNRNDGHNRNGGQNRNGPPPQYRPREQNRNGMNDRRANENSAMNGSNQMPDAVRNYLQSMMQNNF